jgi:CheY-like chemotaxis protein/anti-sigma regulatory factor (Ser/Thr protein kinase)
LTPLEQEFRVEAERKGLDLRILHSTLTLRSDRKLLRRILQNLISNAIKYTREGRVVVGCKRHEGSVKLMVCDTGYGIPLEQQKTIFLEFERLGQDQGAASGLGLGLSIVDRMCRLLRHPLHVRSTVGQGSAFTLKVPLGKDVPDVAEIRHAKEQPPSSVLNGMKVLAIDNEAAIVEGLQALLGGWGMEVITATTSAEALAAVDAHPDLSAILADYHINRDDGIVLINTVRQQIQHDVTAILITADRSLHVRNEAAAHDIVYLQKPVKPAALRAALSQPTQRKAAE